MGGTPYYSSDYAGVAGIGRRVLGDGYSLPSQFESDVMAMCLPGTYSIKGRHDPNRGLAVTSFLNHEGPRASLIGNHMQHSHII
ncbi:hypothetical protein BC332_17865 [Capsicum chinense]|nr:hypothetical protein BC332_17865 [Capsicum chinense]